MNDHNQAQHKTETSAADASAARRLARRRLLKGGAGVAPVLLTLGSKPAMAGNMPCAHHQSGWASAGSRTTVDNGDHSTHNSGCTPDYWYKNTDKWPQGCNKNTTTFSSCLGSSPDVCADKLLAALTCSDNAVKQFAASYLNCKAGKYGSNTIMTEANLRAWWPVCKSGGESSIGTDGKLRKSTTYVKGVQITASTDSRAGGFVNLMSSINTKS